MPKVKSREFQRNVGLYQDIAQRHAVTITKHGRNHAVLMAVEEYDRLKKLDRQARLVEELPDEIIDAIEDSEVPPGHGHLDAELEE